MKITDIDFLKILELKLDDNIKVMKSSGLTEFWKVVKECDGYLLKSVTSEARSSLLYLYNKEFIKQQEHILTENEKAFVDEYLKDGFEWIVRSCDGELYVNSKKPEKADTAWFSLSANGSFERLPAHLFQFVKWEDEEPTNLKELNNGN